MSLLAEINEEAINSAPPATTYLNDQEEEESVDSLKEDVYANENSGAESCESESESDLESEEILELESLTGRSKLFREDEAQFQAPDDPVLNENVSQQKVVKQIT